MCRLIQTLPITESGQSPPPQRCNPFIEALYSWLPPSHSSRGTCEKSLSEDVSISEVETGAQIQSVKSLWDSPLISCAYSVLLETQH